MPRLIAERHRKAHNERLPFRTSGCFGKLDIEIVDHIRDEAACAAAAKHRRIDVGVVRFDGAIQKVVAVENVGRRHATIPVRVCRHIQRQITCSAS